MAPNLIPLASDVGPLSVPGPGRTLTSATEPLARPFRQAVAHIEKGLNPEALDRFELRFRARWDLGEPQPATPSVAAHALASMWAAVRVAFPSAEPLKLTAAENQFFQDSVSGPLVTDSLNEKIQSIVEESLFALDVEHLRQLLPYVLDYHGPGSRRDVLRDPSRIHARQSRRGEGAFYTPSDVTDFMAGWVTENHDDRARYLDPACGSAVFPLSALRHMLHLGTEAIQALVALYGFDVNPRAINAACFVLAASVAPHVSSCVLAKLWHLARLNFVVADALALLRDGSFLGQGSPSEREALAAQREDLRLRLADVRSKLPEPITVNTSGFAQSWRSVFPESSDGFQAIFANPPYASIGARRDLSRLGLALSALSGAKVTRTTNTFIPFMEFMWAAATIPSRTAMIVPFSITYGSASVFESLRKSMMAAGGRWTFRSFDRTPDAMFGDDVKQRVAIVTREIQEPKKAFCVRSSGLHRWTSRSRHELFSRLPEPTPLGSMDIAQGVPRIGPGWEKRLFIDVRKLGTKLGKSISQIRSDGQRDSNCVAVGVTAYNWLVLYRDYRVLPQATASNVFRAAGPVMADWFYAVLASRVTYWLWRVQADGFHVPIGFVLGLPYQWSDELEAMHSQRRLANLGRLLWREAAGKPVRSVNGGRETVSYRIADLPSLDAIDREILAALGQSECLVEHLREFTRKTAAVGRPEFE